MNGRAFGEEITYSAQEDPPFGWNTVAPYAHLPLEFCQP